MRPRDAFTDPESPAPTVDALLRHLQEADAGGYLYRGQVREYAGPLLPSCYRATVKPKPIYDQSSPEYRYSLRRIGRRFVGNAAQSFAEAIQRTFPLDSDGGANRELALLRAIQNDYQFAVQVASHGFEKTVQSSLRDEVVDQYASRLGIWKRHVDAYHRLVIRNDALLGSFGYLIGEAFAQQFGFSSEALDASTDLDVAAYFATHLAPAYIRVDTEIAARQGLELGVIYRFPRLAGPPEGHEQDHRFYYHAPGTVVLDRLLQRFETPRCTSRDSLRSFREYQNVHASTGERQVDRLRLPVGAVAESRIGSQRAALIIPDELRAETSPPLGASIFGTPTIEVGRQGSPVLSAIEDLRHRDGVSCYYFRHTDDRLKNELTASHLWPNTTDPLLRILVYLLTGGFQICHEQPFVAPPRVDLIDPGFGKIDFDRLLEEVSEHRAEIDSLESIVNSAASMPPVQCHLYLLHNAATLCQQGHVEASAQKLQTALALCQKASLFDTDSLVLALLEHIIYIALGDRGEDYGRTWAKAMALAGYAQDFAVGIFKDLFYRRFGPEFAHYCVEYYQSC